MAEGQITVENSREKSRPNPIPGNKPFVKGDPRIKAGPGRPPLWWKHQLGQYEESAIELIGAVIEEGRRRLRKRGKDGIERVHLAAAQEVLDRLHGRPTQPLETLPRVDFSGLSDKELETLNRLLARVIPGDGSGGPGRGR
jgi:hypothetical protein